MEGRLKCGICGSTNVLVGRAIACGGHHGGGCQPMTVAECQDCRAMYVEEKWHVTTKPEAPKRKHHPDYLEQPEARRWSSGALPALMAQLRKEAIAMPGKPQWRVLSHGALVSLRYVIMPAVGDPDKLELRIARKAAPTTPEGWDKWQVEIRTFLKFFGREWLDGTQVHVEGKCDVLVTVPFVDEDRCARCGAPAEKGPFKEALCNQCAIAAGEAETYANRVERTMRGENRDQGTAGAVRQGDAAGSGAADRGERAVREASDQAGGGRDSAGEGRDELHDRGGRGAGGDHPEVAEPGAAEVVRPRDQDSLEGPSLFPEEP